MILWLQVCIITIMQQTYAQRTPTRKVVHLDLDVSPRLHFPQSGHRLLTRAYRPPSPSRRHTQNSFHPTPVCSKRMHSTCNSFKSEPSSNSEIRPTVHNSKRQSSQSFYSNHCKIIMEAPTFTQPINLLVFQNFFPKRATKRCSTQNTQIYAKIRQFNQGLITKQFVFQGNNQTHKTRASSRHCNTPVHDPEKKDKAKVGKTDGRAKAKQWDYRRKGSNCVKVHKKFAVEIQKGQMRQKYFIDPWETLADRDDACY